MNKLFVLAAVCTASVLAGCVTMTEKIEPSLLTEATAEQKAQIDKLGKESVAKREERLAAEKAVSIAEALIAVSKEQVRVYEQNAKLYNSQSSLYTIEGAKEKIDAVAKDVESNNRKIVQEKANSDYLTIWMDQLVIEKELRELELSSLFAQSDVIKATAAYEFQVKRLETKPIDVEVYKKNAADLGKKIESKQAELKKAADKTARAKDALAKTGYGVQQ